MIHLEPARLLEFLVLTISIQAMHAGVIRDMEQQRLKKERQLDFEVQAALEAEYRNIQNVSTDSPP